MNTKEHYDHHLGYFYSWMVGDFEEKQKEQEDYFNSNSILPTGNKTAIDLGAGHGLQSISLAKSGFHVVAVDFNKQLLHELEQRSKGLTITIIEGDIKETTLYSCYSPELVVCMGDTITHLHSEDELITLAKGLHSLLQSVGKFIISFRDFTNELKTKDRFIPVRSDENRIHTCFLEYFPDHVAVTDILQEREKGHWVQKISSYRKLRISLARMEELLRTAGFIIKKSEVIKGMNYIIAAK
jgi:hypothetical protein